MTISDFRSRVVLQARQVTKDKAGGVVVRWTGTKKVWAHIKLAGMARSPHTKNLVPSFKAYFRYGVQLDETMRLKWGKRTLKMTGKPVKDPESGCFEVMVQ